MMGNFLLMILWSAAFIAVPLSIWLCGYLIDKESVEDQKAL